MGMGMVMGMAGEGRPWVEDDLSGVKDALNSEKFPSEDYPRGVFEPFRKPCCCRHLHHSEHLRLLVHV